MCVCVRERERRERERESTETERPRKLTYTQLSKARIPAGFLYCVGRRVGILRISSPEREVRRTEPYAQLCFLLPSHQTQDCSSSQGLDEELRDQFPKYSKVLTVEIKAGRQEEGKSSSSYAGYMLLI